MKTAILIGVCAAMFTAMAQERVMVEAVPAAPATAETFNLRTEGPGGDVMFMRAEIAGGGKVVKGVPYSAEVVTEQSQTLADGNKIRRAQTGAIYRDGEGRTRREQSLGPVGIIAMGPAPRKMVFITDPVAGMSYVLNPEDKTAHKLPLPGDVEYAGAPLPTFGAVTAPEGKGAAFTVAIAEKLSAEGVAAPQTSRESLGTKIIEGVQAEGSRTTVTIPAGQIGNERPIQVVSERWYSPQLQSVVLSTHSDPRMGDNTYKLTNVNLAEPPRALFEVPSDYTVDEGPAGGGVRIKRFEKIEK